MRTRRGFNFSGVLAVLTLIVIFAAIFFSINNRVRQKYFNGSCQWRIHCILNATRLYAADYDGCLPSDFDHMAWAGEDFFWEWKEYACPIWAKSNDRGRGYGFNRLVTKMKMKQFVSDKTLFIWDGTDITVVPNADTLAKHLDYRHSYPELGVNVGFLDGRVEHRRLGSISTQLFTAP